MLCATRVWFRVLQRNRTAGRAHARAHAHTHMHTHTHAHACTCTHMHTHTHTCTERFTLTICPCGCGARPSTGSQQVDVPARGLRPREFEAAGGRIFLSEKPRFFLQAVTCLGEAHHGGRAICFTPVYLSITPELSSQRPAGTSPNACGPNPAAWTQEMSHQSV